MHDRGQLDWLVEVLGASAPAVAAAFAAAMLAPAQGWPLSTAMLLGYGGVFVTAFAAMRIVPGEARQLALPDFEPAVVPDEILLLDVRYEALDELLLDQPQFKTPFVEESAAVAELLLDDPLLAPGADSRVVQLFAGDRIPTAGQLKHRIDRHLADGARRGAATDASDVLSQALAELRRSLRQG